LAVRRNNRPAARAARWQRVIGDQPRALRHDAQQAVTGTDIWRGFLHLRLVARRGRRHKRAMTMPPALFSAQRRRAQLARAQRAEDDFIAPLIAESLLDRIGMVTRRFDRVLLVAQREQRLAAPLRTLAGSVEVAAAVPDGAAFDLIVWPGGLEVIDDVPGALVQARQALRPDGLLIGALVGDGSFPLLRRLLASEGVRAIPRMHPQIDLKTLGNLLQRTGFALPVTDVEATVLRYGDWRRIVADLRNAGLAGQLTAAPPPLTRAELAALDAGFAAACGSDGRADEALRILYFTAWAPHPDQQQPARRGNGKSSLADALRAINPPES
jgi:SAM-dependent methyltransferase